jgi:hypothetical protein
MEAFGAWKKNLKKLYLMALGWLNSDCGIRLLIVVELN